MGRGNLTVEDASEKGYISLETVGLDQVIPIMTPLQIMRYFSNLSRRDADRFQRSIRSRDEQSLFSGQRFEIFHSHYDMLSRMVWLDSNLDRPDTIPISQFYRQDKRAAFRDADMTLWKDYTFYEVKTSFLKYFLSGKTVTGILLLLVNDHDAY